jgi:hypothetical protein
MKVAMVETGGDPGHAAARRTYEKAGCVLSPVARYFIEPVATRGRGAPGVPFGSLFVPVRRGLPPLAALPHAKPGRVPLGGLLTSGRAPLERLRVREERLLQSQRSAGPPGRVPLQPQRLQPAGLAEGVQPEEARLRRGRRRAEQPRPSDRPQLAGVRLDPHLVARERRAPVLQGEALRRY